MTQLAFFSATLAARKQYEAGAALSKAGISPGSSTPFAAVNKAFQAAYGTIPLLGCDTATNALKEVGWCLDKDGKVVRSRLSPHIPRSHRLLGWSTFGRASVERCRVLLTFKAG